MIQGDVPQNWSQVLKTIDFGWLVHSQEYRFIILNNEFPDGLQ